MGAGAHPTKVRTVPCACWTLAGLSFVPSSLGLFITFMDRIPVLGSVFSASALQR